MAWLVLSSTTVRAAGEEVPASQSTSNAVALDTPAALKAWREPAKNRRRRIIFNNDGNEAIRSMTGPNVQEFLDARTTALLGSQVDSIFYCTTGPFGTFNHLTKVGQIFTLKDEPYATNRMHELLETGLDPLRVMADFCRKHQLEIFWSFRMNDIHDHGATGYGPVRFHFNKLKTEHPEYLLGTPQKRSRYGAWSGVNYARQEVRDIAFSYAEEICRHYEVDGIELDFFRHPVFFKATLQNRPATDADRAAMTKLVRRIRRLADDQGRRRGRPLLIAMRVPDSVEYCRAIGLDLEAWLADDLLDLLVVAGYFQLNDWEYSVALGHRYGVKVYPSLDEPRIRDEAARQARAALASMRGRAANVWASGADGVYLFNLFDPRHPAWRELGDPAGLRKLDRDFFGSVRGVVRANGGNLPYERFQKLETLNPDNPRALAPGGQVAARIKAGAGSAANSSTRWTLRLRFDHAPAPELLKVVLNGRSLEPQADGRDWLRARLESVDVRPGLNEVSTALAPDAPKAIKWLDMMLEVRHGE